MKGKHDSRFGPQLRQLRRLQADGSLKFNVYQLTASLSGFSQNLQLRADRAFELSAARRPAAGSDHGHVGMGLAELLDPRQRQARARDVV